MDVDSIKAKKSNIKKSSKKEPETPKPIVADLNKHALTSWQTNVAKEDEIKFVWVFVVLLIDAAAVAYLVWQKDWFPIPVVLILSGVLIWYKATLKDVQKNCAIEKLGVRVDNNFYHYQELHSYWIVSGKKFKTLQLMFTKKYLPALSIDVTNANIVEIRESLSKYIPEQEKRGEGFLDKLVRIVGL